MSVAIFIGKYIDMSKEELFQLLSTYHTLSDQIKEYLANVLQEERFPKKHLLLNLGQVPSFAWYIVQGAARVYYYDQEKQQERTSWFWYPGQIMLSLTFFRQLRSKECIELLEESTLLTISYEQQEEMARLFPEVHLIERSIIEEYQAIKEEYWHDCIVLPAKERFQKLMDTHPEVFMTAQIKDIASYLLMHPNSLSRLRRVK